MKMRYRAGDALFREGDPGDFACLILEGSFEVRHDAGGDSVVLGELGPGDLTGEMGVLENLPRSATVAARTDACVEVIPAEAFADWIAARLEAHDADAIADYRRRAPEAERAHPTEESPPAHPAIGQGPFADRRGRPALRSAAPA